MQAAKVRDGMEVQAPLNLSWSLRTKSNELSHISKSYIQPYYMALSDFFLKFTAVIVSHVVRLPNMSDCEPVL